MSKLTRRMDDINARFMVINGKETGVDWKVGQRILRRRVEMSLSLEQLAERVGVDTESLAAMETGALRVPAQTIVALCHALEVLPSWFFSDLDDK